MAAEFKTVRGMRDYLPEKQIFREQAIAKIKQVFEKYGFMPMQTPALEYSSILGKKYGEEERLIFKFKFGDEELGLKYDQTVPTARVYAANQQLGKPFKRYVIDRAWRGERPQAGRLREFLQCDVDTLGTRSVMADAEIIACISEALKAIGIKKFTWRINTRKLVTNFLKSCGVADVKQQIAMRSIDKIDKIGMDGAAKEMIDKGIGEPTVGTCMTLLKTKGDLKKIKKSITIEPAVEKELNDLIKYLKKFGVNNFVFDASLVRGLDYYTGPIFEAYSPEIKGSIAGGGRYDHLIELFSKVEIPATGCTLGLDRILEFLKTKRTKTLAKVFVIPIGGVDAISTVQQLRKAGISADLDLMERGISKNLEYVAKQEIPFALLVGPQELKKKKVKLRDMKTGKEQMLTLKQVADKLK